MEPTDAQTETSRVWGSRRWVGVGLGLSLGAWVVCVPAPAQACSCDEQESLLWPQGDELPADAGIVLERNGCGRSVVTGSTWSFRAFVDDQPVALEPALDHARLMLEPAPEPGARVTLVRCPNGGDQCELEEVPEQARFELEVTDPESATIAPPVLRPLDYELLDATTPCSGEFPVRDWHVRFAPDRATPRLYRISVGPEGDETVVDEFSSSSEELDVVVRRLDEDAGQRVCATVQSFDMRGVEAESVSECYELAEDETLDGSGQGCACSTDYESRPASSLWTLLGGLGLLGLRRGSRVAMRASACSAKPVPASARRLKAASAPAASSRLASSS